MSAAVSVSTIAAARLRLVHHNGQAFNGFNLVVGDLASGEVAYASNRGGQAPVQLQPGAHGISNGQLHSQWPKVVVLLQAHVPRGPA